MPSFAWSVHIPEAHDAAISRVTALLAAQGFGVLTRIDVHNVLKQKINADFRPYTILGACNPHFAHQALSAEPSVGILLPCNVVVEQDGEGSRVWITDPEGLFTLVERSDVAPIAAEVARRLREVRDRLEAP